MRAADSRQAGPGNARPLLGARLAPVGAAPVAKLLATTQRFFELPVPAAALRQGERAADHRQLAPSALPTA